MKLIIGNKKPEESGKGWIKFGIALGAIIVVGIGAFVAVNNKILGPIILSGMAMVLVSAYGALLMWMSKSIDTMRKVYHAYNALGKEITALTSLTRDLHDVLTTVVRLAEYAPVAMAASHDTPTNSGLDMENAPETNVEEWSLPSDDTVIPFDRRDSAS
jgi:hypothetical protein